MCKKCLLVVYFPLDFNLTPLAVVSDDQYLSMYNYITMKQGFTSLQFFVHADAHETVN